jgi:hypothetical protein
MPNTTTARTPGYHPAAALFALAVLVMVIAAVATVDAVLLEGACGFGPAADTTCTWAEHNAR